MDESKAVEHLLLLMAFSDRHSDECNRRGLRPPLPPAHEYRTGHRAVEARLRLQLATSSRKIQVKPAVCNPIYPSRNPLSSLKRTSIAQLYLEVSAVGKYVIIRVLERGFQVIGWHSVVEDDSGNVCGLRVYNYPTQELFPVGTVLILKEPYFKMADHGYQVLRCDCPTDIIVLRPSHPLYYVSQGVKWKNELCEPFEDPLFRPPVPVAASQWKERGNALYNQKQLILAREAYQLGLQMCQQTNPTFKLLQLNLTAVNLELGYFEKVIEIARDILQQSPTEKKALFRAGRAHYELRQYREALNHFKKIREYYPDDDECRAELERAQHRVQEMESGSVCIRNFKRHKAKTPTMEIDCADYIGPVKVIDIPGKGRGVILREDVEPGTILMISKALVAALDPIKTIGFQSDPNQKFDADRNRLEIVTRLAQLVTKNPTTIGKLLYDLTTGVEPREEIKLFCDPDNKEEPICDVGKIKTICAFNIFSIVYQERGESKKVGEGLFLLPSYLNHSCVPNVTITFYNDVMIVKAAQSINAGDELCTTYVPLTCSYKKRTELLSQHGFKCQCLRCQRRL